jgi:hypothetical protein
MMIDLADCDTMLPSVFDIRPNLQFDAERRPYLSASRMQSGEITHRLTIAAIHRSAIKHPPQTRLRSSV